MVNYLKPDPKYRRGHKDPKRLAAIHNLPCSLCYELGRRQTSVTEAHHKHGEGLGVKASDLHTMSLCRDDHTSGPFAFHFIGRKEFEKKYRVALNIPDPEDAEEGQATNVQDKLIEITNKLLER